MFVVVLYVLCVLCVCCVVCVVNVVMGHRQTACTHTYNTLCNSASTSFLPTLAFHCSSPSFLLFSSHSSLSLFLSTPSFSFSPILLLLHPSIHPSLDLSFFFILPPLTQMSSNHDSNSLNKQLGTN